MSKSGDLDAPKLPADTQECVAINNDPAMRAVFSAPVGMIIDGKTDIAPLVDKYKALSSDKQKTLSDGVNCADNRKHRGMLRSMTVMANPSEENVISRTFHAVDEKVQNFFKGGQDVVRGLQEQAAPLPINAEKVVEANPEGKTFASPILTKLAGKPLARPPSPSM